ncbi:MAG: sulfatase, partial [Verrucomicrobiota bacterium]|nr:sulfatase [Verrucomicrobiota bacterium]
MLVGMNVVITANEKPNVVFFLVDDLGWGALSSMGSDFHETPNIDKLAKSG